MDARATTTAFQRVLGLVDGERQRFDCLTTSLFGRSAWRTEHLGDAQCGGGHIGMTRVGSERREPVGDGTRRREAPTEQGMSENHRTDDDNRQVKACLFEV